MPKLTTSLLVAAAALLSTGASAQAAASLSPSFYPNDPYFFYDANRPDLPGQWHLVNLAPAEVSYDLLVGDNEVLATLTAINAGYDVNIKGAWASGVTGNTVVIGIIDDGVEGNHEDLAPNYRADLSRNFSTNPAISEAAQGPLSDADAHGVAVAGVAAARGGNGIGVTGAAPYAQIAGLRIGFDDAEGITNQDITDAFYWKSGVNPDGTYAAKGSVNYAANRYWESTTAGSVDLISVKNNSWGTSIAFYNGDSDAGANLNDKNSSSYKALVAAAANNVILLFAAGNEREGGISLVSETAGYLVSGQAGTKTLNASDPVITVAAFGSDGKVSYYSNYGSAIFVTAPSNSDSDALGITTTDRADPGLGYNTYGYYIPSNYGILDVDADGKYHAYFGGTSSATPLVSGIIALGKQVAPNMDVRFAKHVLARTSRLVDPDDQSLVYIGGVETGGQGWVTNAAGYHFNGNYGFGLIDATAYVSLVERAAYVTDRTAVVTPTVTVNELIPLAPAGTNATYANSGLRKTITVPSALSNQPLETVEVSIKVSGQNTWTDLHIDLISPSGTEGDILLFDNIFDLYEVPAAERQYYKDLVNATTPGFDWTFTMNNFWGENPEGDWTLRLFVRGGSSITLESYALTFNMGDLVLESDTERLHIQSGVTVKAHSLNLDLAGTSFIVDHGGTFVVTDSFNVYGGSADISGVVTEGTPALNPTFDKGSQIYVGTGGTILVRETGEITARRGIIVNGGVFDNRGTLNISEEIYVANGGEFFSAKDIAFTGDVTVNGGTFSINTASTEAPHGNLTVTPLAGSSTTGTITLQAGEINVPDTITATGNIAVTGGRLTTTDLTTGGTLTLDNEGIVFAETVSAVQGGIDALGGYLAVTGNLNLRNTISDTRQKLTLGGNKPGEGQTGKFAYYSPGGFAKIRSGTDAVTGNAVNAPVTLDGDFVLNYTGVYWVDVKSVDQPDGTRALISDVLHVTGNITLGGGLFINPLNAVRTAAGAENRILLLESESPIDISGTFEPLLSNLAITPTLHYEIIKEGTKVYGEPRPNYNYTAAGHVFTWNQHQLGVLFNALYSKIHPEAPVLPVYETSQQPVLFASSVTTGSATASALPPGVADPEVIVLDDAFAAADGYNLIFAALDSTTTFEQLTTYYDQLAPTNSLVLGETVRQQLRAPVTALRSRSREARTGFFQPGSLWSDPLFGDTVGFNFNSYNGQNEETPATLWANGGGSISKGKRNETTRGYDTYGYSVTVGADYRFHPAAHFGVLASFTGTETDFNTTGIKNSGDSIFGGLYAIGHASGFFYSALVGGSSDSYSLKRNLTAIANDLNSGIDGATGRFKGTPDGSTLLATAEIGWEWRVDGWSFGPIAAIQYSKTEIDDYTESGGSPAIGLEDWGAWQRLTVGKQTIESLTTSLGLRCSKLFSLAGVSVLPEIRASWIHEFENDRRDIHATFNIPTAGAWSFVQQGVKPATDYINASAAFSILIRENISVTLEYDVFVYQQSNQPPPQHQISATFRISF
jgi:subtilisin family serine protease/uncharacterized protein YhjY with autotransporter beta-barrel domain